MASPQRLLELLAAVKQLAREYYELTQRPLGITGEIAEYEAARVLGGLELSPVRQSGFDAIRITPSGDRQHLQIKGRRLTPSSKSSQRVGSIHIEKEWDAVLLVLLDEHYNPTAIHEAGRLAIEDALLKPGSVARNQRGQLSVSKFKSIGREIWTRP